MPWEATQQMWNGSHTHQQMCDWSSPCVCHCHTLLCSVILSPCLSKCGTYTPKEHTSDETNFAVFTAEPFPLDKQCFLWNTLRKFLFFLKGIWEKLWNSGSLLSRNDFGRIYHPAKLCHFFPLVKWETTAEDWLQLFHDLFPNTQFLHQTQWGHVFPRLTYSSCSI